MSTTFQFVPYYGSDKAIENVEKKTGNFYMAKEGKVYFDASDTDRVQVATVDGKYIHDQSTLCASWEIEHNLGKFPNVTVIDKNGDTVFGDIVYNSLNKLTINFSIDVEGKAYCS